MTFGNVQVGSSSQQTLTISNTGNATLTVNNISYPQCFAGAWSGNISAGGSHNVTVTFTPAAATTYGGTITVNSNASSGVNTIACSGTGTTVPAPVISLSGDMTFGNVQVGSSLQQTLTISNTGNATLTVSNISYPQCFAGAWSGNISAGGSHNVTVTFTPAAATTYGGTITVNSNASSGVNTIACSGTGTTVPAPVISLSGDMTFGNVQVGSSSQQTLTISNTGNATLTVNNISYPQCFAGAWSGNISAGGSHNVTVTFTPAAATTYGGTITVNSNASSGVNTIACSGTGTTVPAPVISLSGDMTFGNVQVGSSLQQTLTISNTGNATLTVSNISYPQSFAGAWSGNISAGGSHNVTVTFTPAAATTYGGTITVNSNASSGVNTIACSGTGTTVPAPVISLSGDMTFGNVQVGSSLQQTLTISNTGNATLTVNSISYPQCFSGAWSGNISAGGSHNVTVTFAPATAITYNGLIEVNCNASSGNTINCSGSGSLGNPSFITINNIIANNFIISKSKRPLEW